MGWKNVKESYGIVHTVQVTDKGICIGSPYIHDLIVIGLDGAVKKRDYGYGNQDLKRYMQEFDADPDKLKRLVLSDDHFAASVTVFTYDGGDIVEKLCEAPGWPNVTHDGEMMYDNTFENAKRSNLAGHLGHCRIDGPRQARWQAERRGEVREQVGPPGDSKRRRLHDAILRRQRGLSHQPGH